MKVGHLPLMQMWKQKASFKKESGGIKGSFPDMEALE